jgi:hypothetical protein
MWKRNSKRLRVLQFLRRRSELQATIRILVQQAMVSPLFVDLMIGETTIFACVGNNAALVQAYVHVADHD